MLFLFQERIFCMTALLRLHCSAHCFLHFTYTNIYRFNTKPQLCNHTGLRTESGLNNYVRNMHIKHGCCTLHSSNFRLHTNRYPDLQWYAPQFTWSTQKYHWWTLDRKTAFSDFSQNGWKWYKKWTFNREIPTCYYTVFVETLDITLYVSSASLWLVLRSSSIASSTAFSFMAIWKATSNDSPNVSIISCAKLWK